MEGSHLQLKMICVQSNFLIGKELGYSVKYIAEWIKTPIDTCVFIVGTFLIKATGIQTHVLCQIMIMIWYSIYIWYGICVSVKTA